MKTNRNLLFLTMPAILLTGCTGTDIRRRISPDILAADIGQTVQFAAHDSSGSVFTAAAVSPLLMETALQNASGNRISTGHLSMLLLHGSPAAVLPEYFQRGWITPGCEAVYCPDGACRLLTDGTAPAAEQIRAAVRTGMLPCRTADAVIGDLSAGSGVTAVTTVSGGRLTLMLFSGSEACGTLSEDACRGLALLGRRWESFSFSENGSAYSVRRAVLHLTASETDSGGLCFAVTGRIFTDGHPDDAAADRLCSMLTAALTETAQTAGADILMLREAACRDGVSAAENITQEAWREMLKTAAYRAVPEVTFGGDL